MIRDASTYVEQSDIWRLEILLKHGGLYVDVDFECLRNFDDIHRRYDMYCGMANTGLVELNNGLIGAQTNHPVIRHCLESMQLSARKPPTAHDILNRTGPSHFTRSVMEVLEGKHGEEVQAELIIFPCEFLFPLPNNMRDLVTARDRAVYLQPHSFAVHHWACSWQKSQNIGADESMSKEGAREGETKHAHGDDPSPRLASLVTQLHASPPSANKPKQKSQATSQLAPTESHRPQIQPQGAMPVDVLARIFKFLQQN